MDAHGRTRLAVGIAGSLALHGIIVALGLRSLTPDDGTAGRRPDAVRTLLVDLRASAPSAAAPVPAVVAPPPRQAAAPPRADAPAWVPQDPAIGPAAAPAAQAAPPAPSAEEWAFAGRYTLKNSKAYRHTWGQQIRSAMGTAVAGPDQGMVRFRVEIAADGSLTRLETLWTTSAVAERLARQAIEAMPHWSPTPTGRPLIFDRTIAFTPYAADGPPVYRDDCKPDPPAFRNAFAWDGQSGRTPDDATHDEPRAPQSPQALEDCLRQLPRDSLEAEIAQDKRLLDQWGARTPPR